MTKKMRKKPQRKRRPAKQSGVIIAEAAMVLPVFIFVAFVLIDIQWMTRNAQAIEYIVTEAARCEAIHSPACLAPNSPRSYAKTLAANVHLPIEDSQIQTPACSNSLCSVTIAYKYKPLGAWFPALTITRTGSAAEAPAP